MDFGLIFDTAFATALAAMLGDVPIMQPFHHTRTASSWEKRALLAGFGRRTTTPRIVRTARVLCTTARLVTIAKALEKIGKTW